MEQAYLNEKEVSTYTGLPVKRLQMDRYRRKGIPYHKPGSSVKYALKDIQHYMEQTRVDFS